MTGKFPQRGACRRALSYLLCIVVYIFLYIHIFIFFLLNRERVVASLLFHVFDLPVQNHVTYVYN